jgi:hypothetical protein
LPLKKKVLRRLSKQSIEKTIVPSIRLIGDYLQPEVRIDLTDLSSYYRQLLIAQMHHPVDKAS